MTPEQVKLMQDSFAKVTPIADQAAVMFDDRLFAIAPEVQPLFQGDLAKRHVDYGVKPKHCTPVGAALLWTPGRGLGEQWTKPVSAAWTEAYTTLSDYMIGEAYGREAAE